MGNSVPLSVLDLASVREGKSIADSFDSSLRLAQHAEKLGYRRFWMAEHHNLAGIASAATSVLLCHVAGGTSQIRVGSGGIMLPNHAPLVIAEQFGTLETLFPGRIDLGLGRAPGTDRLTMQAIRKGTPEVDFAEQVQELQHYLAKPESNQKLTAIPGAGLDIPLWILGSSLYSAQLAAAFGLPYAFAGHFAPDLMLQALSLYHRNFTPSPHLDKPHTIVCVQGVVAETDDQAHFLATTLYQRFLGIIRNDRTLSAPPKSMESIWTEEEKRYIQSTFRFAVIGGKDQARRLLENVISQTRADEIMVCSEIYDQTARLKSFELLSEVAGETLGNEK